VTRFVLRRLVDGALVLVVVSVVVFSLLHLAPGDPAAILAGADANPQTIEAIRRDLGLDRPAVVQYFEWVSQLARGDLGRSYVIRRPIAELIGQRIGSTLQLTVSAALTMALLGTALGVTLATTRSRVLQRVVDTVAGLALALPPFVSGVILIFLFAVVMQVLPSGGDGSFVDDPGDAIKRLILPSLAMAIPGAAVIARLMATEMRRAREQEFVLTAMAKGARARRITWRHVLPNSLGPAIIEFGIRVGHLLGGAIVAEAIFARSGLGSLLVQAVQMRDYRLAQVLLLMAIAAAILVQIVAEVVIARVDPRIRLGANS
jgi:peptide/nickel transport system permease protein